MGRHRQVPGVLWDRHDEPEHFQLGVGPLGVWLEALNSLAHCGVPVPVRNWTWQGIVFEETLPGRALVCAGIGLGQSGLTHTLPLLLTGHLPHAGLS